MGPTVKTKKIILVPVYTEMCISNRIVKIKWQKLGVVNRGPCTCRVLKFFTVVGGGVNGHSKSSDVGGAVCKKKN